MNPFDLDHLFRYHEATPEKVHKCEAICDAAKAFAEVVVNNTQFGSDQAVVIQKIREAAMMANAVIALEGRIYKIDILEQDG